MTRIGLSKASRRVVVASFLLLAFMIACGIAGVVVHARSAHRVVGLVFLATLSAWWLGLFAVSVVRKRKGGPGRDERDKEVGLATASVVRKRKSGPVGLNPSTQVGFLAVAGSTLGMTGAQLNQVAPHAWWLLAGVEASATACLVSAAWLLWRLHRPQMSRLRRSQG